MLRGFFTEIEKYCFFQFQLIARDLIIVDIETNGLSWHLLYFNVHKQNFMFSKIDIYLLLVTTTIYCAKPRVQSYKIVVK
jgi:hypothetical protein